MTYTRKNKGVCSLSTEVTLTDDGVIESVTVVGGCNGNLKGISALLTGLRAEDAIPGKGIAIDGLGIQTFCRGKFLKSGAVVPSRRSRAAAARCFFKGDTYGCRAAGKCRGNAGCQPISTGRSDD